MLRRPGNNWSPRFLIEHLVTSLKRGYAVSSGETLEGAASISIPNPFQLAAMLARPP